VRFDKEKIYVYFDSIVKNVDHITNSVDIPLNKNIGHITCHCIDSILCDIYEDKNEDARFREYEYLRMIGKTI